MMKINQYYDLLLNRNNGGYKGNSRGAKNTYFKNKHISICGWTKK